MKIVTKKYKDYSRIKLITNTIKKTILLYYFVQFLKDLGELSSKEAIHATDMPTKIIKENKLLISYYIFHFFIYFITFY